MLESKPQSLEFKKNVAFLGLLLNRDTERATQFALEVYQAAPTNAVFVSAHAFALHAQGKSAEGLKLLEVLPEAQLQQAEIAMYYAILLAATGRSDEAVPYFAVAEKAQLLPEERKLLEQARAKK